MSTEPQSSWELWARRGLNAAGVATSLGFYTAKKGTQIGFGIARGVTSTVVTVGSTLLSPITPAPPGSGLFIATTITSSLNLMEQLALFPLDMGQAITSTSFTLASSSIDVLTSMFGSNEASFSLVEFITLVRREWNDPVLKERLPADKDKYGVLQIGKALIAWAALQCATRGWHEDRWRSNMREIGNEEWTEVTPPPVPPKQMNDDERKTFYNSFEYRARTASTMSRSSRVLIREDAELPEFGGGHVLSMEIGDKWDVGVYAQSSAIDEPSTQPARLGDIRLNLRRLSKMVLGGYGGASLLFFGIPFPSKESQASVQDPTVSKTKSPRRHRHIPSITIDYANRQASQDNVRPASILQEEGEALAQLLHDVDEDEAIFKPSTLSHSRNVSISSFASRYGQLTPETSRAGALNLNRFPATESHYQATSSQRSDQKFSGAKAYPNSIGPRAGGVPFPSVSTTNLNSPPIPQKTSSTSSSLTASPIEMRSKPLPATVDGGRPSWWQILTGRHDKEIFEGFAAAAMAAGEIKEGAKEARKEWNRDMNMSATIGAIENMPRFWVLTDHARRQVVLILRGTMSLNELAVDLTCEPVDFEPHISRRIRRQSTASLRSPYLVHSGMLRMAQVMGSNGKPVHSAVRKALRLNRGYDLVLSGHSLGAGVAGLLALMWADPTTCLTVPASGLAVGRRVSAYCIAPPGFTSAELSRLSSPMITSFVYSHDVVSRLSLGSIRDLSRACWWLSDGKNEESSSNVIKKSWGLEISTELGWWGSRGEKGKKKEEDQNFLLSLRKTLEANMHMADLFPAGNVFWAVHENDIEPGGLPSSAVNSTIASSKLKLFQVERVEKVFDQIIFSRDMLSSHMPHNYDRTLHEYL
ncbi:hypothetical protein FRC14_005314 [Serendipita sp. 396]|nr:hypothetical protein FRC14_005314 [Serendipita sp. 396]KAG8850489.1 hypothetical protein FRB91_009019 [Serendipita sp. 411]